MSPRRLSTIAALAFTTTLALGLSGCASDTAGSSETSSPVASATSTSGPVESSTPTPTATANAIDPANLTCETILPPATLSVFAAQEKDGFTLQADFADRSRDFGSDLVHFVDFGGILCQWGYPSGTEPIDYGFSPITDAQATERITSLTAGGFVETDDPRGTLLVNADSESFPGVYLFLDGYWVYASQPDMLDLITSNLPPL